jgi:hypothetical protein
MFQLAEINVATLRAPLTDPQMADFVAALGPVNALADASPGFVWRLQDQYGAATEIRAFDDPLILVNLSVWESIEALWAFTYRSHHLDIFKQRARWFAGHNGPQLAMWWVRAGHLPTVEDGRARLESVARVGPSPFAFTFTSRFAPEVAWPHTPSPSTARPAQ